MAAARLFVAEDVARRGRRGHRGARWRTRQRPGTRAFAHDGMAGSGPARQPVVALATAPLISRFRTGPRRLARAEAFARPWRRLPVNASCFQVYFQKISGFFREIGAEGGNSEPLRNFHGLSVDIAS